MTGIAAIFMTLRKFTAHRNKEGGGGVVGRVGRLVLNLS
jgi:hypothetical protein